jgi:hypothetical protein
MGELTCYIHKDRTAIAKCSTCHKYICLECKRSGRNTGFSDENQYYICPLCLANEIEADDENSEGTIVVFFVCFIFIICITIIAAGLGSMNEFHSPNSNLTDAVIVIFVIVVLILIGIGIYANVKKEKEKGPNKEAAAIRTKVKNIMEETSKKVALLENDDAQKPLYCRFCGAPLPDLNSKECEYCGMTWIIK